MIDAVIDASVVARWLLESTSDVPAPLLEHRCSSIDFMRVEVANAIWAQIHAQRMTYAFGQARLEAYRQLGITEHAAQAHLPHALEIAGTLDHPVYDCLYLALAITLDCKLHTANRQFVRRVQRSPWKDHIVAA